MRALPLLLVAAVVASAAVAQTTLAPDPCAQYDSCSVCVGHYLCGWCSGTVIYPGNVTGKPCAGYNPNGEDPFECTGIYSIEQCAVGYECDLDTYQCKQAQAGQGKSLTACEANCTNMGQVYLCNHTTLKCQEVPRGTQGAASYAVCEASCAHPSAHPAPPASPSPPATVYACNTTTGQCDEAPAGKGSSKQVCQSQCTKSDNVTKYFCNSVAHQCEVAPQGFPGVPKSECEAECLPHPNPGPPQQFVGTWRGIAIQNGYKPGEFDLHVDQTSVVFVDIVNAVTIKGQPYNVQNGDNLDLWIKITAGPGAGQTIKAIGSADNRGPETSYLLAAFSAAGGATPASIAGAMAASSGDAVYFFMQCAGTPECRFVMPSSAMLRRNAKPLDRLRERVHRPKPEQPRRFGAEALLTAAEEDPCSPYNSNCSYCLSHPFCGWCSQPVTYKNGVKGTQCAGFASSPNETNPFVCEGHYSTLDCTMGWTCNETTLQCVQDAPPGDGYPLTECEEVCRPTPSPTPLPQQWVCNTSDLTCYKCEDTHCPGSMPQATCEASCKKPHKGPTALVIGIWRGLEIQNGYPLVEVDYVFNASSLTVFKNGEQLMSASVTSFGGDEMVFDVTTGENAGSKFSAQYTVANQGTGVIEMMTIAMSAANGPIPDSYSGPMQTAGEKELVMAKCNMAPCQFTAPSN